MYISWSLKYFRQLDSKPWRSARNTNYTSKPFQLYVKELSWQKMHIEDYNNMRRMTNEILLTCHIKIGRASIPNCGNLYEQGLRIIGQSSKTS